ncbi:Gfo/Idh/MocA family protein [Granulicella arctica]|uniref:Putative dehydrogenase n=1 Tax=Granulicella arctica TaxID=940613 RepID=A0A7Y9PEZ6_9BACT|nr:Gfo/Idh/MocA family oxidoreductase [Granulicella arctica]NYF78691.1 putative dehydrogenase [Granulicella arctica]
MDRRRFMATGSAASGLLLLKAKTVFGYEANSAVRLGLLGCGGRGTAVASSFAKNTSARVVALADMFPNQLEKAKTHFDELKAGLGQEAIDARLMFRGPEAFEEIAQSKDVDMVQISTPPWFHVGHLRAVVSAGKHAYCEKPTGVDVAQAREALEIARSVNGKVSIDVGFQVRNAPPIAAVIERVKGGALGKIASITANYNAPGSKLHVPAGAPGDEFRLRNWLWDRALSGDILVEQNIHIIDLCNLVLGSHPLKATATGGRNVVQHEGNCWDNYQVEFTYPEDVRVSFSSTQFGDYGFNAGLSVFGSEGRADAPYAGPVRIQGKEAWAWQEPTGEAAPTGGFAANGDFKDNLGLADREKDRAFIESITSGKFHNQIAAGVETARSCMLGRMAGLTGRTVTWDELLAGGETYPLGMDLGQFK